MAVYKGKKLADMHGAERAARIKQLLANPGTRKLVPDADLPSSYRAQRQLNTRLNAPIVAGSSTTNRDLAHQREAAVTTQFGPNAVGAQQFREKQTNAWFDEYQRQMAQHRANTAADQAQEQAQIANLGNVQGPPGSAPQDPGNQDVAAKAQAIRSTLLGAQKGQLLGQGQAATTYADTLANVVAPGQKVQALSQAAGATDALKQKIGAFRTQFEGDARTSEGKNVLAQQALTGKTAAQQTQDAINAAKVGETVRHNKAVENKPPTASEQKTQQQIDFFNKHGYYPPTGKPKKPKAAKGTSPEWLTNEQMGAGLTQVVKLKDFALKAKTGQPFVPGHKPQGAVARAEAAKKIYANAPSLKDPALLSAALDAAYDGHLSSETVKKLIAAGYKPAKVAQALGVQTAGQVGKTVVKRPPVAPGARGQQRPT
jgi:hypothetical protein